jgi:hypothetical protein
MRLLLFIRRPMLAVGSWQLALALVTRFFITERATSWWFGVCLAPRTLFGFYIFI